MINIGNLFCSFLIYPVDFVQTFVVDYKSINRNQSNLFTLSKSCQEGDNELTSPRRVCSA